MLFRITLLGISFIVILFFTEILMPRLRLKYHLYKESKEKNKRKKNFKNHMKELEIN